MSEAADRWAGRPGPRKVLDAARQQLQEGNNGDAVRLRVQLSEAERTHVARLLGTIWDASGKPVTLGKLRSAITRLDDNLLDLLTRTGGPVEPVREQREQAAAQAAAILEAAYTLLRNAGIPAHAVALARERRWLERPKPEEATSKAEDLRRLWNVLPGGTRPLAELATSLYADPHRLDRGLDLGRTAARLLAAAAVAPDDAGTAADTALTASRWRQVWAHFGVNCDEVSATVLVLNLRLSGAAAAVAIANAAADFGEPVWLTSRSLRGEWKAVAEQVVIRVCETPAIAEAAAERLGRASLPLVCIYGRPSSAAWTLLHGLASSGVHLLVTADRDSAGTGFLIEMLALATATEWLQDVEGLYEEARLEAMIADLTPTSGTAETAAASEGR